MNFKVSLPAKNIFSTVIAVRINNINYGNHLGHDSLVSFFHEARVRFLAVHGCAELDIEGFGILVTNLVVNYVSQAHYSHNILINIGIGEIKKSRVDLIYQATNQETNKEVARALTTLTFYDFQNAKIVRIPPKFLSFLEG